MAKTKPISSYSGRFDGEPRWFSLERDPPLSPLHQDCFLFPKFLSKFLHENILYLPEVIMTKFYSDDILLAQTGSLNDAPEGLHFLTENEHFIQVATFNHKKDHVMRAHRHIERPAPEKFRTEEVLLVWKGHVRCTVFNVDGTFKASINLHSGDFIVVHQGGVKYEVLEENTIMMEAKTGPFTTSDEDRVLL